MSYELLIIVPARGGSKRLPGKNLMPLGGETLLSRVNIAVRELNLAATVMLTTDDTMIAAEGKRLGWLVPFMRPDELATDAATTNDAIVHLLDWRNKNGQMDPELIMVLQPTSPFRRGSALAQAELIRKRDDVDSGGWYEAD
jgi:CMP-N-acetylneuraminic acid synthetase